MVAMPTANTKMNLPIPNTYNRLIAILVCMLIFSSTNSKISVDAFSSMRLMFRSPFQQTGIIDTSLRNQHDMNGGHHSIMKMTESDSADADWPLLGGHMTPSSKRKILPVSGLIATVSSWIAISWRGLMYHPNPKVAADLTLRHNLLTIGHAWILPLSVTISSFWALMKRQGQAEKMDQDISKRLYIAIALLSFWTGAAVYWGPVFSVGYDLFPDSHRYICGTLHAATGTWAFVSWFNHAKYDDNDNIEGVSLSKLARGCLTSIFHAITPSRENAASQLYAASFLGLLSLAIMPQLVAFPTATIPMLLGKRLSRGASGFTFLASVMAYCLLDASEKNPNDSGSPRSTKKILRRGLAFGSIGHSVLLVAKVIGVDGGGLLFPGSGLQILYPSLIQASGASKALMTITLAIVALASTT